MSLPRSTILRNLLLLLVVVGPLQVQALFACAMMDTVVDNCCCVGDARDDGYRADDGDSSDANLAADYCCDSLPSVKLDAEDRPDAALFKAGEVRSDVDPPLVSVRDLFQYQQSPAANTARCSFPQPCDFGSELYLTTQRLRI